MKKGTKLLIAVLSLLTFFFVSNKVNALDFDAEVQYVETNKKSAIVYLDSGLPDFMDEGWYAIVYKEKQDLADMSYYVGKYVKNSNGIYDLYYQEYGKKVDTNVVSKLIDGENSAGVIKGNFDRHFVPMGANLDIADKNKRIDENNYAIYDAYNSRTQDEIDKNQSAHSPDDINAIATIENITLEQAKSKWGDYLSSKFLCNDKTCDSNGDGVPDKGYSKNFYYKFIDSDGKVHLVNTKNKNKIIDVNVGTSEGITNPCKYLFGDVTDKNSAAYLIQSIFNYMKFIGIVLAVIMTIVDLTKAVAGGNMEDEMKKIGPKSIKRIAYAILIFLLPTIINVVFKIFGLWGTCNIS